MALNISNATFTSDNGREFDNGEVKQTLEEFGCNQMMTAAINPTSNNIVERCVGETKRKLRKLNTNENNMSQNLELVVYTHNSSPQGTKVNWTPFELAFARPNTKFLTTDDDDVRLDQNEYERQFSLLQYQVAAHTTQKMVDQLFLTTPQNGKFKRLDFCLVLAPAKPNFLGKTGLSYIGPCIITKLFGRNGYIAKCIYTGQSYKRNGKYVKKLNLSNELKRDIKNQLVNLRTSSLDPDSLEEIISTKLNEKTEIDQEIRKEIKSLVDPPAASKNQDEVNDRSPAPPPPTINTDKNQQKRYNLRERRPINYSK